MNKAEFVFFIKRFSFEVKRELDFLPKLVTRKLSNLDKTAFSTLYDCYNEATDNPNLVFASIHGQFDRLVKLTNQYLVDNEASPAAFSASVHNNTIGAFSVMNKINAPYTSVSAGENTISSALCDAILQLKEAEEVIFCYADCIKDENKSISVLLTNSGFENCEKCVLKLYENQDFSRDEYLDLIGFLNNNTNSFKAKYYTVLRA